MKTCDESSFAYRSPRLIECRKKTVERNLRRKQMSLKALQNVEINGKKLSGARTPRRPSQMFGAGKYRVHLHQLLYTISVPVLI